MAAGILIGEFVRPVPQALNRVEIVTVSLPITLGLWLMMWPVLTKVQYDLLGTLLKERKARHCLLPCCACFHKVASNVWFRCAVL
jgi:ACR3 family arsenite efflux pump ArsB